MTEEEYKNVKQNDDTSILFRPADYGETKGDLKIGALVGELQTYGENLGTIKIGNKKFEGIEKYVDEKTGEEY